MPTLEQLDADALRDTVTTYRDAMRTHQASINRLNVYPVPDGDTGTNMARTLDAVVAEMNGAGGELDPTCDAISYGALMGARGNSGVILSQILRGIASTLKGKVTAGASVVADALTAASDAAYTAVLKPIEGTILTVVRESAAGAKEASANGATLADVLRAARDTGRVALARTPEQLPVLKDAGVVDAGGAGYLLLLDSALHVVDGEPLPEPALVDDTVVMAAAARSERRSEPARVSGVDGDLDVSDQRYEVMFLCNLADKRIDELKQGWGRIGDSIVVVGGDGIWNCHVHTNDIGAAIETALDAEGRPFKIRITDLFEEMEAEHAQREADIAGAMAGDVNLGGRPTADADLPPVTCAVVAVSSGDGISALFKELGVQLIVSGGQTLNPSTAELLDAVKRANAQNVILLPGNKNIIPVAEQVDALTDKTVRVVPTRSMPEGLAALMAYDPEVDAPANVLPMRHAAEAIVTGEVTRAVRSSKTDAGAVAEGDWMGIASGANAKQTGIVAIAPGLLDAAESLLEHLIGDECELVTVITGADASDELTAALEAWFADRFAGVELEVHRGGQPLYPFLFGVE